MLVNTVESSNKSTPVIGMVMEDVYQERNGARHLIIPSGTVVAASTGIGAVRDRIEVAGPWVLDFKDGREVNILGLACVREGDPSKLQLGPEDGSAGLKGEVVTPDASVLGNVPAGTVRSAERFVRVPSGTQFYIIPIAS